MITVLAIIAALILPLTIVVLSVSMNELEKNTRALGALLLKRYTIEPKKAADPSKQMPPMTKATGKA